ncbi:MAG: FecR family protein [Chthoniobacterales bacterium]
MRRARNFFALTVIGFLTPLLFAQQPGSGHATLLKTDRVVEISRGGAWSAANAGQALNAGDQLRTGEDSRATVQLADGSVLQLDELTTIEIKPSSDAGGKATLSLPKGSAFFFSRGKSHGEVKIETPAANGAIRGTAFVLRVTPTDTAVSMIQGAFALSNSGGAVTAHEGQSADAGAGGSPTERILSDSGKAAPWYLVLENRLGRLQSLRNASRTQFFSALPDATKQFRIVAPQLAGAATYARTEWALDILRTSFAAVGSDCGMRARILRSVTEADPADAAKLLEQAIELGPSCAGAFAGGGGGPGVGAEGGSMGGNTNMGNVGNPPGSNGGGGVGNLVAVCFKGQTLLLTPDEAQNFIKQHPGATLGACQVTPVANP